MIQLGLSAFYHDSAACLLIDGKVIAAVEEERFTGIKHDSSFPFNSINWCLSYAEKNIGDINQVCWYENPETKKDRVLKIFKKRPIRTFLKKRKFLKEFETSSNPAKILQSIGYTGEIKYTDHHLSHAAFSYYTSPFEEAAILTIDGVGEWETLTISHAKGDIIEKKFHLNFPNSLGMLYSTITAYLGFKPNEGEYKVMGLAPYGDPAKYYDKINKIFKDDDIKQKYFAWEYSDKTMFSSRLSRLLKLTPRHPEDPLTQDHKDLAAALQKIYENKFMKYLKIAKNLTGSTNICLGGGCAYNGVANNKANVIFKKVFIPFAPSDAGSAIGSCLHQYKGYKRSPVSPFLGPEYNDSAEIIKLIKESNLKHILFQDEVLFPKIADLIASGKIIAWFQGRMEFGARALGNRSILATPRDPKMREKLNHVIKKREGFRPFAPSVIYEDVNKWFLSKNEVPYMNLVVHTVGYDKNPPTVYLPAATHIDNTARIHTVTEQQNPRYYKLLQELKKLTSFGVVLNTSFNLKDETITMTPQQAIERFCNSEIDYLVINNFLIIK